MSYPYAFTATLEPRAESYRARAPSLYGSILVPCNLTGEVDRDPSGQVNMVQVEFGGITMWIPADCIAEDGEPINFDKELAWAREYEQQRKQRVIAWLDRQIAAAHETYRELAVKLHNYEHAIESLCNEASYAASKLRVYEAVRNRLVTTDQTVTDTLTTARMHALAGTREATPHTTRAWAELALACDDGGVQ